ncbi:MAG: malonyl CoA-acyl carrier protein transacylase [Candidatus Sericytochromatia bacterium]|nr:MAG: malonyl CoA-acyl carrier protein transacylase [Candidatus Sericytochromatia bacterium]
MNSKIAFLFPGQGSQYPKMGIEFFNQFVEIRNTFEEASKYFKMDIANICFNSEFDYLQKTNIAQPCILTISIAIYNLIYNKFNIKPSILAGHSLGEYTALFCGGVLSFKNVCKLVKIRSDLMSRAGDKEPGTMIAVLGLDRKKIERYCEEFSSGEDLVIANYNSSEQFVISGKLEKVKDFSSFIKNKGAKVLYLNVSGAFHSPLMGSALDELITTIDETEFKDSNIPIVTNIDNTITLSGRKFKEKLKWQLVSPVLWEDSIKNILSNGINIFLEIGPSKVLTKLAKKIDKNVNAFSIEKPEDIETFIKFYEKFNLVNQL